MPFDAARAPLGLFWMDACDASPDLLFFLCSGMINLSLHSFAFEVSKEGFACALSNVCDTCPCLGLIDCLHLAKELMGLIGLIGLTWRS
jgi:hypothetical protein